jgi:hypothetical protein
VVGVAGAGGATHEYDRAAFLGWIPLVLAVWGAWSDRRRARFWVGAALVFALLALGPTLQIAGVAHFGEGRWTVPLPYRLVRLIPGINIARIPSRFSLVVTLCLAVLAGLGLAALMRRWPAATGRRAQFLLPSLLVGALLTEQFAAPFPTEPPPTPAFYHQLARSDEIGTVLELPFSRLEPRVHWGQTIHRRPIVGGYLSRDLDYPLLDLPPFRELAGRRPAPDITPPDELGIEERALAFAGVRWIVVRLDLATPDRPALAQFLARWAEPEPIARDDHLVAYRARSPDPRAATLALRPADGWYEPEPYAGGRGRMRWFRQAAGLHCWNFGEEGRTVALRFEAWSLNGTRRLEVAIDGRAVGQWAVSGPQRFDIPLTLTPGQHHIALRALDPPARPVDLGLGDDPRPLAFGVANVELRR